jgi:hypothetical protein
MTINPQLDFSGDDGDENISLVDITIHLYHE